MYSYSDTYYRGTQQLDKRYTESNFDYSSLALSYGISSKLRITADVGYYFDKAQRFVTYDPAYTRYARGLSDATVGFSYSTYLSDDGLFDIAQAAKITLPVGAFNQEYDGVILPIDFQPSAGNYKYNFGVVLSKRFTDSPISLMSSNSIDFPQAIETNNTYHKYGNLYSVSLMGIYQISTSLQGLLQFRFEMRDRALNGVIDNLPAGQSKNNQYSYINSSGGVIAYISPQLAFSLFRDWSVSIQYNYPIYKNIYGLEQLTNRHSITAYISHSINFGTGVEATELDDEIKPLSMATLTVQGNCDMCKTRIEKTAKTVKDVYSAQWDAGTKILTVRYTDVRPDSDEVEKALAAVGHDTEHHTATDDAYGKLPTCCLYRK